MTLKSTYIKLNKILVISLGGKVLYGTCDEATGEDQKLQNEDTNPIPGPRSTQLDKK